MSRGWLFKSGEWNYTCDSCGQKLKSSKGKLRWDGFRVCPLCWEARHPQDFLRARKDQISVPWSRPKETLTFVPGAVCSAFTMQGRASYGTADCAKADTNYNQDPVICVAYPSCIVGIYVVDTTTIGQSYDIYCFDNRDTANNFINNGYQ